MGEHFDIAVLGSGPGGYIAVLEAAQCGAKVAVVEKGHLGGTCLNVGCIPSKALLASAELLHSIEHAWTMGIKVSGKVSFDWPKIQGRKDKVIQTLRGGIKGLFAARKVRLFQGYARLDGPGRIAVTKDGADGDQFTAKKVIIASGSVPSRIPDWPTDPAVVCTSDEALHWEKLPKRLLIVGGGVIGCEFACMSQPFGVEVTVVEMMPRLLPELEEELGGELLKVFKKRKITCHVDTKVENIAITGDAIKVTFTGGKTVDVDKVLVATGRKPNTEDIGLETVGITTDRGFIGVNDRMETPVGGYYCIGDANGRCLLAHAASAHGVVAVKNALGDNIAFDAPVPSAVYTFPEIATVGLTAQQAREKGIAISIGKFPMGHLGKAMAVDATEGFVKVVGDRETGRLLGVHMMGHNVTECIASAGALLGQKVTVHDIVDTVFAHPTISEALKESAEDALGKALHLPPRKVARVVVGR